MALSRAHQGGHGGTQVGGVGVHSGPIRRAHQVGGQGALGTNQGGVGGHSGRAHQREKG